MNNQSIPLPKIVSQQEWQTAHDALLIKEKEATKARDKLNAERRRLPMVKIDKTYLFGLSAQDAMNMGNNVIDPKLTLIIIMESAIPMSKMELTA